MPKILITGATGNIGKNLIKSLKQKNADIIALTTNEYKRIEFQNSGIESKLIDFSDQKSLTNAFKKAERLFLLNPLVENFHNYIENAVFAVQEAGIEFILRNSGFGASLKSTILLNKLQGKADDIVKSSGINYAIGRPNSFMQNLIVYNGKMIKNTNKLFFAHGNGKISFIDVRDIAEVYAEILINPEKHFGKSYDLTGKEALDNYDIAEILSEVTGKTIEYIEINDEDAKKTMRQFKVPEWNIDVLSSLDLMIRNNYAGAISGTFEYITGKEPIKFAEFAKENADEWR